MTILLGSQYGCSGQQRLLKIKDVIPKIDHLYQSYANNNKIPGFAYAIMADGVLVHSKCDGYANIANKTLVTPNTVFRIASLTKSFTAMAILKLRDTGKLRLEDKITLYVPEMRSQTLTQNTADITILDLLTHTAGLPQDDPWGDRKLSDTTTEFLALLKNGICFSNIPGTKFEYSNLGYTILGYIVSKISGISCQEFIRQHIWLPLEMHSATWEYSQVAAQDLAHGYQWNRDHWQEEQILHDGVFACMGGMMVSIADFSKYLALHQRVWLDTDQANNDPVCKATLRAMQRAWVFDQFDPKYKLLDGTELGYVKGYGLGLYWGCDAQGKAYVFHPGSLPGFHAHWMMLPEYGIAVVVMGNIKNAPRFDVNMQALNTLVKEADLQARTLNPSILLVQRQQAFLKLLPDWQNSTASEIFAPNFFLDKPIEKWQEETKALFAQAGKLIRHGNMVPENQLRGYCMLECERATLKLKFTLAPEGPALIQELTLEAVK